ncbi:MAG: hypothetical protein IJU28_03410 [Clostridia bacterium]|nr:hypothetical protein [Clostridia bacterium]
MISHFSCQITYSELSVENSLKHQNMDAQSELYGSLVPTMKTYFGGEDGSTLARTLIVGYYLEGSKYYRDALLLGRAHLALEYCLRQQKADGTFDLKETNLHDGAQTSFIVTSVAPAALLMRAKSRHTPEEDGLYQRLLHFLDRCADGMVNGGFHTPNHRWVMSSALGMCHALLGREDCLKKMRQLLNEGIDQDADGEYTEHSGGVYNVICDRAFVILAFACGMPEMYDTVTKNLRMVLKYIEPDLTVNTMNSSRQDAGTSPTWLIYYGLYLFMALRTGDKEFRFIADRMLEQFYSTLSWAGVRAGGGYVPFFEYLPFVMMDETLQREWDRADVQAPDMRFTKLFSESGVLRHRQDSFSLTLVKNNPDFALLKFGQHSALLRLCGTFYAQGQFVAEELTQTETGWHMVYRRRWGYKSPLPERQDTTDWRKMDHTKRSDVMMQDFIFHVDVEIIENGAKFRVRTEGVECVLVKLEILLDPGAIYTAGGVRIHTKPGEYLLQAEKQAEYAYADGSALRIEGGQIQHNCAERMRGSLYRDEGRFTVTMTWETPMESELILRFRE